ncbi:MAG: MATE family efflux transporter [Chloroflexota bacterium]
MAVPEKAVEQRRAQSLHATRDLTKGSVPRNLWFLWPQLTEGLLNTVDQLADLVWAGHLGAKVIAGLGVAQIYTQLGPMVRQGLGMASRAMIARAVGAKNIRGLYT